MTIDILNAVDDVEDVYQKKEVLDYMKEKYSSAEDSDAARAVVVMELAGELGKSQHSIRGKLKWLNVYKPKVVAKKRILETKDRIADKISMVLLEEYGVRTSDGEIESLTKANKTLLNKLLEVLETKIDF